MFIGEQPVDLAAVLTFWTGANKVSPASFGRKLTIKFYEMGNVGRFPFAKTCALGLEFPYDINTTSTEDFNELMVTAILGCQGFDKV